MITLVNNLRQHQLTGRGLNNKYRVSDLMDNEVLTNILGLRGSETVSINGEPADMDTKIRDGATVSFSRTSGRKG